MSVSLHTAESEEKQIEAEIALHLENLLRDRLGPRIRYRTFEELRLKKSNQHHWFYRFDFDGEPRSDMPSGSKGISLFVKRGPLAITNPDLERFLGNQTSPLFRAPKFVGSFNVSGNCVASWEYIPGNRPEYGPRSLDSMRRIVEAVSGVNALTPRALEEVKDLPIGTPWVGRIAVQLLAWLSRVNEHEPVDTNALRRLDGLVRSEEGIIDRLRALDGKVLNHHDITARNLITSDLDRRLTIIDWPSAAISAPGASLRFLGWWDEEPRRALAAHYVESMLRQGYRLTLDDVLFAIETQQMFWALRSGFRKRDIARVQRGLQHAAHLFTARKGTRGPEGKSMKPAPEKLKHEIMRFAKSKKGRIYAPILHPEFEHIPSNHKPERFDAIAPYLEYPGGTVLDIGTHWGYLAHRLEDMGYKVTAIENSPRHAFILRGIRDICNKKFEVREMSIFDLKECQYDIVIAMNIFHHFLKKQDTYDLLKEFLGKLQCKMMIFQAHFVGETQMGEAYCNMHPEEFAHFVANHARIPKVQLIGQYRKRKLFKMTA